MRYYRYLDDIDESKDPIEADVLVSRICQRDLIDEYYYELNNTDLNRLRDVAGNKIADKLLKDMPGKFKEMN